MLAPAALALWPVSSSYGSEGTAREENLNPAGLGLLGPRPGGGVVLSCPALRLVAGPPTCVCTNGVVHIALCPLWSPSLLQETEKVPKSSVASRTHHCLCAKDGLMPVCVIGCAAGACAPQQKGGKSSPGYHALHLVSRSFSFSISIWDPCLC